MRSFVIILLALSCSVAVTAETSVPADETAAPPTLLQRLLQDRETERPARPIGQCVFACGDGLIEVERCPDGDCPVFECGTRAASCPIRERQEP